MPSFCDAALQCSFPLCVLGILAPCRSRQVKKGQKFQPGDFSENRRASSRITMPGLPPVEELPCRSTAQFLLQNHANQIVQQYISSHKFQEMAEKTQFKLLAEEFLPTWFIVDTSSFQRSGFQKDFWVAAGDSISVKESAIQEQRYDLPCAHISRSLGSDLMMSPRAGAYDLISDNTYLQGNRWLQLELKATESASLVYQGGNLSGYVGVRNSATFLIWSLVDSKKKQGMWHCLIPSGQITGKQLSVPTSYTLAQIKKWVSEKFDGGHAFESLRELHHHIIFCWAMQGVKLASLECSIIQGAHMAMQYGLVSAPQKSQKVSLKWKPLQQCSDAEKPGQNSTGHEVLDGYDSFVLW